MDMEKTYQPQTFEKDIYQQWMKNGYFTPQPENAGKPYFSIVSPPPNITGQLHLGHALDNAIMDSLVRFKRMQGYNTLWLPGTDHASIATEVKIVEKLRAQGIDKRDLSREEFLAHAWAWKDQYGGRIVEQLKLLGSSCDWSRLAFTMDDKCSKAVKHVFVKMYRDGHIYQGNRIINWCPHCKTALSDAEVEYVEQAGSFWHYSYYTKDGKEKVTFATTRPETMLGDTAVAVNPNDARYKDMVGKTVVVPFVNREIPVIADEYVDMTFGTGVVKITPAHDPNDFEVGKRHGLAVIRVMNDDGTMNEQAGEFAGLDRYECRRQIVEKLREAGNLVKIEAHTHNVGTCYRCDTTVEPIVSKQWFVAMETLAKPAIEVVKNGTLTFHPERFEKTYFNWMENIKDWCISRQLWWGHRIPVWYCDDCGEVICAEDAPAECPKCGNEHLRQDEDVLDTWFSSALWPFSTMGYPDKTADFDTFFPTSVLSCGSDIIFFWVARMVFSSLYNTGTIPFKDVLMHGMVRDSEGRKMSKSLGNGIDPVDKIEQYGADTLRFALLTGVANGSDMRYSDEKMESTRNFMNKIYNASRFVLMNCDGKELLDIAGIDVSKLTAADRWILFRLNESTAEVTNLIEKYELGLATQALYDFSWTTFCDWYIEFSKPILYGTDEEQRKVNLSILVYVLDKILKLLHPFCPFITEKIYQELPTHTESIMTAQFPTVVGAFEFRQDAELLELVKELIVKIRNIRAEYGVIPSKRIKIKLRAKTVGVEKLAVYIEKLAGVEQIDFVDSLPAESKVVTAVLPVADVSIPLGDLVDKDKEVLRLNKEIAKVTEEIARANSKLNNAGFVDKAPAALIDAERAKLAKWQQLLAELTARLKELD
jgi:valyl-tRNA synthetase